MRTIAIGDIHGCLKALRELWDWLTPQPTDHLIFLGDYVDRGPDSCGVIDFLLQHAADCQTHYLRGNHEIMLQAHLTGALEMTDWGLVGGYETLLSYGGSLESFPKSHHQFLSQCLPYLELPQHALVHANYQPERAWHQQTDEYLYWRHLSQGIPGPHGSGKQVICGHSMQHNGEILDCRHLICIDTACVAGGWLTAFELHSHEVWQVDAQGLRR